MTLIKRIGAGVVAITVLAAVGLALAWATAEPLAAARRGSATFDELTGLAAGGAAWLVLGWVAAALATTALAALPGTLGQLAGRLAGRIAPGVAGRLARVVLGLTLTAGPVSACTPALAGDTGPAVVAATQSVGASKLPSVGRIGQVDPPAPSHALDEPRPPIGTPAPVAEPTPQGGVITAPTSDDAATPDVVVQRGDTLWAIAARHLGGGATDADIAAEWPRWYAANREVIGDDPDLILPGLILRPPAHR